MVTAISQLREPDWLMLKCMPSGPCAEALHAILKALDGADRFIYAVRGEALRLFDSRNLCREFTDPATGLPCSCTYRFLEVYLPDSARYAQESLVNRQKLADTVPLEVAAKVTRANLRLLEDASDSVRRMPEVQQAAQTMTEQQFAAKLTRDHDQHLETSRRFAVRLSATDHAVVLEELDAVGQECQLGAEDRAGQLLAMAIERKLRRG